VFDASGNFNLVGRGPSGRPPGFSKTGLPVRARLGRSTRAQGGIQRALGMTRVCSRTTSAAHFGPATVDVGQGQAVNEIPLLLDPAPTLRRVFAFRSFPPLKKAEPSFQSPFWIVSNSTEKARGAVVMLAE
jgi:hypothetical protein